MVLTKVPLIGNEALRPYQVQGVKFLVDRGNALLADEMGLGKTVQAAVASKILIEKRICRRILIVCPATLCRNWELELKQWAAGVALRRVFGTSEDRRAHYRLPFKLWIASYEQIRNDMDFLAREPKYDLVILDEAQRIKNANTSAALACRQLRRSRAWAITGTPIENKPEDLIAIFSFIKPGLLTGASTRKDIHDSISNYFLRRTKKDVLRELPEIIIQDLKLEMEARQREAYEDAKLEVRERIRSSHAGLRHAEILAQITKLKLLCNYEPNHGESCKLDALETILEGLEGEKDKIVIFSQYVGTLNRIRKKIKCIPFGIYYGGIPQDERDIVIREFEEGAGPRALLISLRAGGVGLNINSASTVILFDRWWNPAVEDQAIQRAHRFGRERPLHVIRFLVLDSIEERIEGILYEKRAVFKRYVNDAEVAEVGSFSFKELLRILGLEQFE